MQGRRAPQRRKENLQPEPVETPDGRLQEPTRDESCLPHGPWMARPSRQPAAMSLSTKNNRGRDLSGPLAANSRLGSPDALVAVPVAASTWRNLTVVERRAIKGGCHSLRSFGPALSIASVQSRASSGNDNGLTPGIDRSFAL